MKDDKENKKYEVQYEIDIPVVVFSYKKKMAIKKPFSSKNIHTIQCLKNSA
jgi:hypothetical protein